MTTRRTSERLSQAEEHADHAPKKKRASCAPLPPPPPPPLPILVNLVVVGVGVTDNGGGDYSVFPAVANVTVQATTYPNNDNAEHAQIGWVGGNVVGGHPDQRTVAINNVGQFQVQAQLNAPVITVTINVIPQLTALDFVADPHVYDLGGGDSNVFQDLARSVTVQATTNPNDNATHQLINWNGGNVVGGHPEQKTVAVNNIGQFQVTADLNSPNMTVTVNVVAPPSISVIAPPVAGGLRMNQGGHPDAAQGAAALAHVRVGIWDDLITNNGVVRNGAANAHFIDLDSRCFHIRVYDHQAGVNNAANIQVQWRTIHVDQQNPPVVQGDDDPAQNLTLDAIPNHAGWFISRGVMLVTDADDRAVNQGGGEDRLRRITVDAAHPLTSEVYIEYTPAQINGQVVPDVDLRVPIFDQTQGNRNGINIHLVNVRNDTQANGGQPVCQNIAQIEATLYSVYAVCGIFPALNVVDMDPPASCTGWAGNYNLAAGWAQAVPPYQLQDPSIESGEELIDLQNHPNAPNSNRSPTQLDMINAATALVNYQANDICLIFVWNSYVDPGGGLIANLIGNMPDIDVGAGGEAFPDSQTGGAMGGNIDARGFAFISVEAPGGFRSIRYGAVHEVTHLTTNFNNEADGHYYRGAPNPVAAGAIDGKNLMHPDELLENNANPELNPKRLWDTAFNNNDLNWQGPGFIIPTQITTILASRFVFQY
jgi:hypothetical protein